MNDVSWAIIVGAIVIQFALICSGGLGAERIADAIDRNTAAVERLADAAEAPQECLP